MYGEFYPTGYYGATPQMQDRLAMLEQQRQMQRPPQPMTVRGHLVTGIEEARAAQVMLDGTPSYFPSPAEGKIYEKSIDLNGMPVFKVYVVSNSHSPRISPRAHIRRSQDTASATAVRVRALEPER